MSVAHTVRKLVYDWLEVRSMQAQDGLAPWPMSTVTMINCLHICNKAFAIEAIRYSQWIECCLKYMLTKT